MKTTEEKNRMIAEFMGWNSNESKTVYYEPTDEVQGIGGFDVANLVFHYSWDWLMPVVRKLKKINSESKHGLFEKPTDNLNCQMMYEEVEDCLCDLNVENAYNAVCAMIYWLTKNNRYEEAKSKDC